MKQKIEIDNLNKLLLDIVSSGDTLQLANLLEEIVLMTQEIKKGHNNQALGSSIFAILPDYLIKVVFSYIFPISINKDNNIGTVALSKAMEMNQLDMAELLVKAGVNIDLLYPDGNTLLTRASKATFIEQNSAIRNAEINKAIFLVKMGANVNIENNYGYTAARFAYGTRHC